MSAKHKWRIGDRVWVPAFGPRDAEAYGQKWHPGVVELIRGEKAQARAYGCLYTRFCEELRPRGKSR